MTGSVRKFAQGANLFILAHPDDEIAFAAVIDRLVREREPVRIIYLTDGGSGGSPPARRAETVRALASLGVEASHLCFAGHELGIADGLLYRRLRDALGAVERWSRWFGSIARIYTLAWEGGHPDHDAAHVVAAAFAAPRGLSGRVRQVPFYRASDFWFAPAFVLNSPLPANGPVDFVALSRAEQWRAVKLVRFYRSQWRSFAGLGPVLLWHAVTRRAVAMQRISDRRLSERPTAKPLLYEARTGPRGEQFMDAIGAFLASVADDDPVSRTSGMQTA